MFYDYAKIKVKGGDGGNGVVAWRREKYVAEGGPNGGDGGRGGNVVFVTDEGLRTLVDFRYQRHYTADRGEHGQGKGMHGAHGEDLIVRVPVGTVVKNSETKEVLADLVMPNQTFIAAKGGRGGRGNARFVSSTHRAPTLAENGEPGQDLWLELELKLLADVGLVGFPNVGKSTLISHVSEAKPKIANYHFTTLVPNLGLVRLEEGNSFVLADIPGLIEGASEGVGLGHRFLRHVERTRVIIHVLDIAGSEERDPIEDFHVVNEELAKYKEILAQRPQIIAANKTDLPEAEDNLVRLRQELGDKYEIFPISAVTGKGLEPLMYRAAQMLKETPVAEFMEPEKQDLRIVKVEKGPRFNIHIEDDIFVVSGSEVEKHFAMTNFENEEAVRRFLLILDKMGVSQALREKGAKDGDVVRISDIEFDWVE